MHVERLGDRWFRIRCRFTSLGKNELFDARVDKETGFGAQPQKLRPELRQSSGEFGVKQFAQDPGNAESDLPRRGPPPFFVHEQQIRPKRECQGDGLVFPGVERKWKFGQRYRRFFDAEPSCINGCADMQLGGGM